MLSKINEELISSNEYSKNVSINSGGKEVQEVIPEHKNEDSFPSVVYE